MDVDKMSKRRLGSAGILKHVEFSNKFGWQTQQSF